MLEHEPATSLSLLFGSAFFSPNSNTLPVKEAECWYTFCLKILTSLQISTLNGTDLRKSRGPGAYGRCSKFQYLLPFPAPCVTMLDLILSTLATLICLSFSASLNLHPPSPTCPQLWKKIYAVVFMPKVFLSRSSSPSYPTCHFHCMLHLSFARLITCFIINTLLPTKMLTPWRQVLYLTHLY